MSGTVIPYIHSTRNRWILPTANFHFANHCITPWWRHPHYTPPPPPQRPEGARTLPGMDLIVVCHPQMSSTRPPTSVPWVSAQTDEFRPSKIVRWQKFNGFKIRNRTFAPMKFPANGGLPTDCAEHLPLIPITHRPRTYHTPMWCRRATDDKTNRWFLWSDCHRWGTGSTAQ